MAFRPCRLWSVMRGVALLAFAAPAAPGEVLPLKSPSALQPADPVSEDFGENPDRIERELEEQMTARQYLRAYKTSGMEATMQARLQTGVQKSLSSERWVSKGPRGIFHGRTAQGRVTCMQIIDDAEDPRVYVGAVRGGLWRSTVATLGVWRSIGDGLGHPSVGAFDADPRDGDHIVVGTGNLGRKAGAGMFQTWDEGVTWEPIPLPQAPSGRPDPPNYFGRVAFLHTQPTCLVAASGSGLLRSTDRGSNWVYVKAGNFTDLALQPNAETVQYAWAQGAGLYRSTNYGKGWDFIDDPNLPSAQQCGRGSLAVSGADASIVVLVVEANGSVYRICKSNRRGINGSWADITGNAAGFGGQAWHALAVAIHPTDSRRIYVGVNHLIYSDDSGKNWQKSEEHHINAGHDDITQLYFSNLSGPDFLWICNDGGIYLHSLVSTQTISAIGGDEGLAISEVEQMDADRSMRVAGLQDNGVLFSTDAGATWTWTGENQDGGHVVITDPVAHDFWFDGWGGSDRTFRQHGTQAWEKLDGIAPFNPSLCFDPYTDTVFYDGNYGDDGTGVWSCPAHAAKDLKQVLPDLQPGNYDIRGIFGSRADGKTLYVTYWGNGAIRYQRHDLTICAKGSPGWSVRRHLADLNPGCDVVTVAPSSEWPGECWVGFNGDPGKPKIFHTVDYGEHWDDVTGAELVDMNQVVSIVPTPFDPNTLYVTTDMGVFRTKNGGGSWQPFMDGLPSCACKTLKYVVNDKLSSAHTLVLATCGRGIYERTVAGAPVVYVDKNHTGFQDGSLENPFSTVQKAVDVAPAGAIIAMRSEVYEKPRTITKNLKLVTWAGTTELQ